MPKKTEKNVYNYRKDYRTDEQFKYKIAKTTTEEERYLRLWVETHNKRRKKREITLEHWGNNSNGNIVYDLDELKGVCRPDFILNRCYDNSYVIRSKQPIEVQTCRTLRPQRLYIKQSKMEWPYDNITKQICTDNVAILFITGTGFKGAERYVLLRPSFLDTIDKHRLSFPYFMGNKPCYSFSYDDVKWREINDESKQSLLEYDDFGDN